MKMTINQVKTRMDNLALFSEMVLPIKLSYAISVNMDKLSSEMKFAEKERIKICERLADKNEDGTPVKEDIGNGTQVYKFNDFEAKKTLNDELEVLGNTEVDVDIRKVNLEIFDIIENDPANRYDSLSVNHFNALAFMIEE